MRGRGFPMGGPIPHKETPASVQAKFGIGQEQWDALPNADLGKWQQLMDKHAPAAEPSP